MPRSPLMPLLRVGAAVGAGVVLLYCPRQRVPGGVARPDAVPFAFTVSLGEDAGRPVVDIAPPSSPFPGQVTKCRPRVHASINGGCWRKLSDTPPCEEAYLWRGGCYLPDMLAQRPATSIHP